MRHLFKIFFFAAALISGTAAHAKGVSEIICDNHASIMSVVVSWRQQGIPVRYAKDAFDHEDNLELRFWLRDVVKRTYKDIETGSTFIESDAFVKKCTEIHRGF